MRKLILAGVLLAAVSGAAVAQNDVPLPDEIVITMPGISPEGIDWDPTLGRFFIGSLLDGSVRSVDDAGSAELFVDDEEVLVSVGIEVDEALNRLLVTSADPTVFFGASSGSAGLAAFDLETGEKRFFVDLGALVENGRHFANDVTVDADGNAYVTDSFSPVIYRVDVDGNADVFLEDPRLFGGFLGANGIEFHPDGFLLVAVSGTNSLYRIPLDDSESMAAVEVDVPVSIDGLFLAADGTLFAINNAAGQALIALTSDDDWATATVTSTIPTTGDATTVTVRDGVPYYINAYLNDPGREQYEIVRGSS